MLYPREIEDLPMYHSRIKNRQQACDYVYANHRGIGTYIVRPNGQQDPSYVVLTISVEGDEICHCKVLIRASEGMTVYLISEQMPFSTFASLLEYHQNHRISCSEDIDNIKLIKPLVARERSASQPLPSQNPFPPEPVEGRPPRPARPSRPSEPFNFMHQDGGRILQVDANSANDIISPSVPPTPAIPRPSKSQPEYWTTKPPAKLPDLEKSDNVYYTGVVQMKNYLKETITYLQETDICECGLRQKDAALPLGWTVHRSKDPQTLNGIFFQREEDTTWEMPGELGPLVREEQIDFILYLCQQANWPVPRCLEDRIRQRDGGKFLSSRPSRYSSSSSRSSLPSTSSGSHRSDLQHSNSSLQYAVSKSQHTHSGLQHVGSSLQHTNSGLQHAQVGLQHTNAAGLQRTNSGLQLQYAQVGSQHTNSGLQHAQVGPQHTNSGLQHTQVGSQHTNSGLQHTNSGLQHNNPGLQHVSYGSPGSSSHSELSSSCSPQTTSSSPYTSSGPHQLSSLASTTSSSSSSSGSAMTGACSPNKQTTKYYAERMTPAQAGSAGSSISHTSSSASGETYEKSVGVFSPVSQPVTVLVPVQPHGPLAVVNQGLERVHISKSPPHGSYAVRGDPRARIAQESTGPMVVREGPGSRIVRENSVPVLVSGGPGSRLVRENSVPVLVSGGSGSRIVGDNTGAMLVKEASMYAQDSSGDSIVYQDILGSDSTLRAGGSGVMYRDVPGAPRQSYVLVPVQQAPDVSHSAPNLAQPEQVRLYQPPGDQGRHQHYQEHKP